MEFGLERKLFSSETFVVPFSNDSLNNVFTSVSNKPVPNCFPLKPSESSFSFSCKFSFAQISKSDLFSIYNDMKNKQRSSSDVTGLAPIMLARTIHCPSVSDFLLFIVSRSLLSNEFSECLKTSSIKPIPKIKNPTDMTHFRPISTQAFLGLLIERAAKKQLMNYLISNDILYRGQFGFRPSHSCDTAMVALTEFLCTEINNGNICILVSLDLAKAFDVIVREFSYEKLKWYGIIWRYSFLYLCSICR
jgi:hypothetical protein